MVYSTATQNQRRMGPSKFKTISLVFYSTAYETLLNPEAQTSWIEIERTLVAPIRLEDYLFSGISSRQSSLLCDPIVSYLLTTFKAVERYLGVKSKWHKHSPLWLNRHLLSGNKLFNQGPWVRKNNNNDINDEKSFLSFSNLITLYNVSRHSRFQYFKLPSALILWGSNLKQHPVVEIIQRAPKRIVSFIYLQLTACLKTSDNIMKEWKRDVCSD